MKVLVYFIKSYFFFFFTILSLLIDCGEKTWSLQIIHFYFEEDFFFFTIVLHMGFSYRDKKNPWGQKMKLYFLGSSCMAPSWLLAKCLCE